mmetsp:Transcript_19808/g.29662  ORF Transcript_19808/g.29662 Transcript_19808/m.29662 type:complete len:1113 (+) Transcript_19808:159-3497(+)
MRSYSSPSPPASANSSGFGMNTNALNASYVNNGNNNNTSKPSSSFSPLGRRSSLPYSLPSNSSYSSRPTTTPGLASEPAAMLPKSTLQNNIGALMLFKGSSIALAKERFYASLSAAAEAEVKAGLAESQGNDINSHMNSDINSHMNNSPTSLFSKLLSSLEETSTSTSKSSVQVVSSSSIPSNSNNLDAQGLTWFHNKLLREVVTSTNTKSENSSKKNMPMHHCQVQSSSSKSMHPQGQDNYINYNNNNNSASSSNKSLHDHNEQNGNDLFMYTPYNHNCNTNLYQHHQKNNHCHFINDDVTLGLEYIHDPIMWYNHSSSNNNNNSNYNHRDCEMNVQIAAGINIALCSWTSNQDVYNYNSSKISSNRNRNKNDGDEKCFSRNRIKMKKAKEAVSIFEVLLEYIEKQTSKQTQQNDQNLNGEGAARQKGDGDLQNQNRCLSCQLAKKRKERKERIEREEQFRQQKARSKSWASVCSPSRRKEKEEDSEGVLIEGGTQDEANKTTTSEIKLSPSSSLTSQPSPPCPDPLLLVIVHNNIGVLYFTLNEIKKALHHFEKAKSIMGSIIERQNKLEQEQHQFQEQSDSDDGGIDYNPGSSYLNETFERRSSSAGVSVRSQLLQSTKYRSLSYSHSPTSPLSLSSSFPRSTNSNYYNQSGKFHSSYTYHQHQKQQEHQNQYQNSLMSNNLMPSMDYLHLTTVLNCTRTALRINDMLDRAKSFSTELNDLVKSITSHNTSLRQLSSSKSLCQYNDRHYSSSKSLLNTNGSAPSTIQHQQHQQHRIKWLVTISSNYIPGLLQQRLEHYTGAIEHYNMMLSSTRRELGHDHIFVAMILEKKGNVLFDQRKCQTSMLSYLASLKIYEHQPSLLLSCNSKTNSSVGNNGTSSKRGFFSTSSPSNAPSNNCNKDDKDENSSMLHNGYQLEQSRLLHAIGRTLHDREEFRDALSTYQKALSMLKLEENSVDFIAISRNDWKTRNRAILVESIKIMCLIGRIHHIMGELELSLNVNLKIVDLASEMVGGINGTYSVEHPNAVLHPFVRNRLVVVGNVYVEMNRIDSAMEVFARVARGSGEEGIDWMVGHLRPEVEDVDTSAFAVRAAERLGELGARSLCPHAAAA